MAKRKLGESPRDAVVYFPDYPVQVVRQEGHPLKQFTDPNLYGYEVEVLRYGQTFTGRIFDRVELMERPKVEQQKWINNVLSTRMAPFGEIYHAYSNIRKDPSMGDVLNPTQGDTMALLPQDNIKNALNPNTEGSLTHLNWLSGQPVHYTVGVFFEAGLKQYAYRVHPSLQLKEGDLVVVKGGTGYQLVKVATVHEKPTAKATAWVVSRVDTEFVDRIQEETALLKSIQETIDESLRMETALRLAESNPRLKAQLDALGDLRRSVTG